MVTHAIFTEFLYLTCVACLIPCSCVASLYQIQQVGLPQPYPFLWLHPTKPRGVSSAIPNPLLLPCPSKAGRQACLSIELPQSPAKTSGCTQEMPCECMGLVARGIYVSGPHRLKIIREIVIGRLPLPGNCIDSRLKYTHSLPMTTPSRLGKITVLPNT